MVFRVDLAELAAPTLNDDGSMVAHARLTRTGVFEYHMPDGKVRRELRLPEDVFSPETMKSFRSRSVTNEHPSEMIDGKNWKRHTMGWLSGKPKQDGDHVLGKLYFPDAEAAKKLWRQGRRQVSLGYTCALEETPGEHPTYGKYDAIQRDIRGNHVAIVDCARAGNTAAVRLDAISHARVGVSRFDSAICLEIAPAPIRRRTRLDGILGRPTLDSVTAQVDAQLRSDYSAEARRWVQDVRWTGPERVALDQINFTGAPWKADHVDHFVAKIDKGWEKPIILLRRPGSDKLDVVDGHNRSLAYRKMGMQPLAYVADSDQDEGEWSTMHDSQRDKTGTRLASCTSHAITKDTMADKSIPDAPQGGEPCKGDPDPKDEASRNAKGENDAKPSDKSDPPADAQKADEGDDDESSDSDAPADADVPTDDASDKGSDDSDSDDDSDDDDSDDDEGDDDDDDDDSGDDDDDADRDAYDDSYNEDGELTDKARHKMAASSFAVPDREGLPIHDPGHTKAAMGRFNQYEFKNRDEKHAAFNRILGRAKHFGIDPSGFQKANEDHLDSKDMKKIAALQKKFDAEKAELQKKLDAAEGRADATKAPRFDEDEIAKRVDARAALVAEGLRLGAKVDAKMTDKAIKIAVIKHLDGADVPESKSVDYVDARYDAATESHRTDAAKIEAGRDALAATREAVAAPRIDAETRMDLATAEEAARVRSAQAYRNVPQQYSADFLRVKGNSPSALAQSVLKTSSEN